MILLLGASGYIGQVFARELQRRRWSFAPLSRQEVDYTRFERLLECLKTRKPEFVINAAGYTGKPNVDACEEARADTLAGNTLFPRTTAQACLVARTPWGHVSSGCIYSGAKIGSDGVWRTEKDMSQPQLKNLAVRNPEAIKGYQEMDA